MNPVKQLLRGLRSYWAGVAWLRRHPSYIFLLILPTALGVLISVLLYNGFWDGRGALFDYILFSPGDSFLLGLLYQLSELLLSVVLFALIVASGFLLSSVLASPIYDLVSAGVERHETGRVVEISLWQSLRLIPEELKKVFAILLISLAVLMVPFLNVVAVFITAFLLGWDFYDYTSARRGESFHQRRQMASGDFWAIMGLGLWLTIPVLQIFLYPFAVVGGTLLNLERARD